MKTAISNVPMVLLFGIKKHTLASNAICKQNRSFVKDAFKVRNSGNHKRYWRSQRKGRPLTYIQEFLERKIHFVLTEWSILCLPVCQFCTDKMSECRRKQGLLVKQASPTNVQDVFMYTLFAPCYGLSDGHPQVNRTNIKRSCDLYNGSVVFSTIMCVSCRKLIAVFFTFVFVFAICTLHT
jgi:hypothetical protein